jgi:hypothetical protein
MDNEKRIEVVREHTELYDLSNSKYSDSLHKENIWEEIAEYTETCTLNKLYLTFLKLQ